MIDRSLLDILVCPVDRGPLLLVEKGGAGVLYNPRLRRVYRIEDGIPVLLADEAVEVDEQAHAQFMARAGEADFR
jgi:uncharacterized protein YbaR (Trm112 family)